MSGFSGHTDHLGLATTNLILKSSSLTPAAQGVEPAIDQKGNTIDQGLYIDGVGNEVECVYELQGGTLNLNTLQLGPDTTTCITEINVETDNGAWPTITASGYTGATGDPGGNVDGSTFTLPSISIDGKKVAQEMGFSGAGTDSRIQSSSLTASGEIHFELADADTVGAVGFTGAELTAEATLLLYEGADTITWADPFEETQPLSSEGEMTGWAEGSTSAAGIIEADTGV